MNSDKDKDEDKDEACLQYSKHDMDEDLVDGSDFRVKYF